MPIRSGRRRFRTVLPHLIILFTFSSYIFLGACGLYFLVFPPSSAAVEDEAVEDSENALWHRSAIDQEQEFIEMSIDITCNEAKKRLEDLDRSEFEKERKTRREELKKFNFTRAVLICFNWITTIGNRWPEEWEYIEPKGPATTSPVPTSAIGGGLISKSYAIVYMLIGIPMTFLTLSNFAALLYDAWNAVCFAIRRRWHAKMILSKSGHEAQLRRDIEESRLWNPLWFVVLLIAYLVTGAILLQHIWLIHEKTITFAESIWQCAALVFAIGETNRDVFVLPQSGLYCLVQIIYATLGLIIFGAFLRSFLPLAARIYQPKAYQIKKREPRSEPRPRSKLTIRRPIIIRQEEGVIRRARSTESPLIPPPKAKRPSLPAPAPASPPRSILRQRNGAYSFEPKRDSFESLSTDDLILPPMVRFTMPAPPEEPQPPTIRHQERRPDFEMRIEPWDREPTARPWASERDLASPPATSPKKQEPEPTQHQESLTSLVFSVSPDSIPYADERISTLIM